MTLPSFEVDRDGLRKLLRRRPIGFLVVELVQNAWDEASRTVTVTLDPLPGVPKAALRVVDDNPTGFADLSHAYTLYADSAKKTEPTKRGRWNLGEKLVIAACDEASIVTTTGGIAFDARGRRRLRRTTESGSEFSATLPMTRAELDAALALLRTLIPPPGVTTTVNGHVLAHRSPIATFSTVLDTEIADDEGYLRATRRQTSVHLHRPLEGERAMLYEIGIPVVEIEGSFHADVQQKVPLNADRDNVRPAYLRALRAATLNHAHHLLAEDDAAAVWVDDALEHTAITKESIERVLDLRYGAKRVIHDPSDQEGTKNAVAAGYTVIPPRALTKRAWGHVREHAAALPAGQVTPSPRPFSPDGAPMSVLDADSYTPAQRRVVAYARLLAAELLGAEITVTLTDDRGWSFRAAYRPRGNTGGSLVISTVKTPPELWETIGPELDGLLLHEFAHHTESDHLSHRFHKAITDLSARLVALALERPEVLLAHRGS